MQCPVGCEFNPDTMRNEMVSFAEVALSPFAVSKFCHTVTSAWIIGGIFVVAVSSWYLLKKRETKMAVESIKIGALVGLVASVLAAVTGHKAAQDVGVSQPMKLAAMEALYNGGTDQGLTAIAWVNPLCQPDYENLDEAPLRIAMPNALSFMATNDIHGYVPGINDILNGYTTPDGRVEPSIDEKIERGKLAITALADYRKARAEGASPEDLSSQISILKSNMQYFGYGYIRDRSEVVPFIPVNFWCFRIMVGLGCLFILFFGVICLLAFRIPLLSIITRRLLAAIGLLPETEADGYDITRLPAWHYWVAIALVPLAYIASESGWLVAEFGRQPWTIQDMLPTWAAVSDLHASSVALTFFLFLILFTTMLAVEISIMLKQIKKGPESERPAA
jgi:cytochrome d ubiquinol oxidase subunit I